MNKLTGKQRAAIIALLVVILLLAAGLIWRLVPRSLSTVMDAEPGEVSSLACGVMRHNFADGQFQGEAYTISAVGPDEADHREIMEILAGAGYRPAFRNLLPWPQTSMIVEDSGGSASVMLVWGQQVEESCSIVWYGNGLVTVSRGAETGFLIYHLSDPAAFEVLYDYVSAHGTAK